jgi:class 3 adenylate cyclase
VNEQELEEHGLYDPDAPNATERLALLRMALEYGATVDEIRQAIEEDRLHVVAAMREIRGGTEHLTIEEVAERAGVPLEMQRRYWRAIGLPDPGPGDRVCTEQDVEAIKLLAALQTTVSEEGALQFARAIGTAMARLADSEVAVMRALSEAPLRSAGGENLEVAKEFLRAAQILLPGAAAALDLVHRRHLELTARRYSLWGVRPTERSTTDAVVGFVDLVGFTTLGAALDEADLDALIRRFEDRALDATRRPQSRLVKLIGDEVMFAAGTVDEAIEIVDDLRADPELPEMRAGIAAGTVIVREGDVFGPVVNLASRLVSAAEPGQTLLDPDAAARLAVAVFHGIVLQQAWEPSLDVDALAAAHEFAAAALAAPRAP